MAASPDPGLATGTPTPIVGADAHGATVERADTGSVPMARADNASDQPTSLPNAQVPEGDLDPEALEEFRADLLSLADDLNELVEQLDAAAKLSGKQVPVGPKVDQELIRELTPEELYILRDAFRNYDAFKENIKTLRALLLTSGKASGEISKGREPLGSFTIIPTPTPTGSGIKHVGVDLGAGTGPDANVQAGDIWIKNGPDGATNPKPSYPDVLTCKIPGYGNRYPNPVTLAAQEAVHAARLVYIILDATCETVVVICPAPGGTTLPGCTARKVGGAIKFVVEKINHIINEFCIPSVDSAEIQASFENTQILHADLDDHDKYLTARADSIDNFLFNFRDLNLRLNIESNLASPDDDPHVIFTLPHSICVSDDLRGLSEFSPDRVAGCGLLEVVSDTVRSAIDMTAAAGQDINNAEAEFQAAVQHYNKGEWKLAYARFRKAYREAVRP
jgi:hypothetical protein